MRGFDDWMSIATKPVGTVLISHYHQDIWMVGHEALFLCTLLALHHAMAGFQRSCTCMFTW
jgi:hypothetical protein